MVRPLSSAGAFRRVVPFAVVVALAVMLLPLGGAPDRPLYAALGGALLALGSVALPIVPWARLPRWTETLLPPVLVLLAIFLLREAFAATPGGHSALAVLPSLWAALYGDRTHVRLVMVATVAVFAAPLLASTSLSEATSEAHRAALHLAVAGVTGPIVHGLVRELAARQRIVQERGASFQRALDAMVDPIVRYRAVRHPSGLIVDFTREYVNDSAATLLGATPAALIGTRLTKRGAEVAPQIGPVLRRALATGEPQQFEFACDDGHVRWFDGSAVALAEDVVLCTLREVTHRRAAFERVTYEAHHDALTGLANRRLLLDRIAAAVAPGGPGACVLFIDLDRFKDVNDRFGHDAGDDVLVEVGRRLADSVRSGDTVGRLGGDEFVVVIPGDTEVSAVAIRIAAAVAAPISTRRGPVAIGASLGHVTAGPGADPQWMLEQADRAMYIDKSTGRPASRLRLLTPHPLASDRALARD